MIRNNSHSSSGTGGGEIITLQCGHYANHVGQHLWNIRDAYGTEHGFLGSHVTGHTETYLEPEWPLQHGVYYRTSIVNGYETSSPRLVILDLKGSLGSYYQQDQETLAETTSSTWDGKVEQCVSKPHGKNAFLEAVAEEEMASPERYTAIKSTCYADELKANVQVWSDYSSTYYHPKSIVEVSAYTHGAEMNDAAFSSYNQGAAVWNGTASTSGFGAAGGSLADEVMDERLRFLLEEADNPQGFQVLSDMDGFSGITGGMLEALASEFPKKAILTFSMAAPKEDQSKGSRNAEELNSYLALDRFAEYSSAYLPLHSTAYLPQHEEWSSILAGSKLKTWYEDSGYLASAVESVTLPIHQSRASLSDLVTSLNSTPDTNVHSLLHRVESSPSHVDLNSPHCTIDLALCTANPLPRHTPWSVGRGLDPARRDEGWVRFWNDAPFHLPASFPQFGRTAAHPHVRYTTLSAISTSRRTSQLFEQARGVLMKDRYTIGIALDREGCGRHGEVGKEELPDMCTRFEERREAYLELM